MVTLPIGVGKAFGVLGREHWVARAAMLDRDRPPPTKQLTGVDRELGEIGHGHGHGTWVPENLG